MGGEIAKAVNYDKLTGPIKKGDTVILNTTAVDLGLGTGGYHFVIFNYSNRVKTASDKGHIMKLRYTPLQIRCLAAEEEDSPYHTEFNRFTSLDGHIFLIGSLHSMLGPVSAMLKWCNEELSINYIMTDGGALPMYFSNTVPLLKEKGLIQNTITIGHAFGGDLECINIYTGLIAAKEVLSGDITIITMGPGIVGTGNRYGFSGIEQGPIIDAVNTLGGHPVLIPRISFRDSRERHFGISHHTRTVLAEISKTPANVILPVLDRSRTSIIDEQIDELNIDRMHTIHYEEGEEIVKAMEYFKLNTTTMGRAYEDDKDYFITLGAASKYAIKKLK